MVLLAGNLTFKENIIRCDCCNKRLSDYETSLKSVESGEYMNTCVKCLSGLGIAVQGNSSLITQQDRDMDDLYDDETWDQSDWEEYVPLRKAHLEE